MSQFVKNSLCALFAQFRKLVVEVLPWLLTCPLAHSRQQLEFDLRVAIPLTRMASV